MRNKKTEEAKGKRKTIKKNNEQEEKKMQADNIFLYFINFFFTQRTRNKKTEVKGKRRHTP